MRTILFIVIIIMNKSFLYSQLLISFSAGANYPAIPYSDFYDHADIYSKVGFTAGSDFTISVYRNLYLSAGISYSDYSAHLVGYESTSSHQRMEDIDLSLGFISLQVMPQYSFGRKKTFFIKAGGYFSGLLISKEVGTYTSNVINGDSHTGRVNRDAGQDYEDIDYGLSANTCIRIQISDNTWLVPQIGYNLGLYAYNLTGSNIKNRHRGGFKSAFFLMGIEMNLSRRQDSD